jgi:hypothetical protein
MQPTIYFQRKAGYEVKISVGFIIAREIFCIHINIMFVQRWEFEKVGCLFNFNLFRKI